ncbi:MAG: formate/nitrite transporter family protein [Fibromonadaceae bacterium]|jgi:formate/nitrite transporter FocA (FNT family)|nr:formate/nitrite transporter family protein [Fibromonadaceae bacterium]
MKKFPLFIISILGGISISMGGSAFVNAPNEILSAFLFSLGLFLIFYFKWGLYTGRVQNLVEVSVKKTAPDLVILYFGNLLGTLCCGYVTRICSKPQALEKVEAFVQYKLSLPHLHALILSILCGIMVYVAVEGFKRIEDPVGKHLAIILPIMAFIFSGFEHSIANLFFISLANAWGVEAVIFSAIVAVGNLIGGCVIPLFHKLVK